MKHLLIRLLCFAASYFVLQKLWGTTSTHMPEHTKPLKEQLEHLTDTQLLHVESAATKYGETKLATAATKILLFRRNKPLLEIKREG